MKRSAELRQKGASALADARTLYTRVCENEKRSMTSDENERWTRLIAEAEQFSNQAKEAEQMERRGLSLADRQNGGDGNIGDHSGGGPTGGTGAGARRYSEGIRLVDRDGKETRALAPNESVTEYLRASGRIRDEHENVKFGDLLRSMITGPRNEYEKRALAEGADATGGVTVPTGLLAEFIDRLRPKSRVIEAGARTVVLDTQKTSVARITTDPTVAWRSENGPVATSQPAFDSIQFVAQSLACLCPVSRELLDDSINASEALTTVLSAAMGGELDRAALIGSGVPPIPKGIGAYTSGTGSVLMGSTAGAPLTNYDPLCDALEQLQASDADDSNVAAIMNPRTSNSLAKLKDLQNNPLRIPPSLANLRFLTTSKMPVNETFGTSNGIASRIILGDWSQLWIGLRMEMRVEVLRELFAGNFQIGFLCSLRADVQVAHLLSFSMVTGITLT